MNWEPSPWFLAEVNHVLAGCLVILAAGQAGLSVWLVFTLVIIIAALKEFWADMTWLEHDSLAGSIADFATYTIGAIGGLLAPWSFVAGALFTGGAILGLTIWDIYFPESEPQ